ncbi:MAG: hypothetical protein LUQ11_11795 [Methylococcaceae bacterium]|nr:hypothetical protein [Methylococcaceae bacterium]
MSIRKFIFCDICNPQGLRSIEFRRSPRGDERTGRRISDGRSWFEGELNMAIKAGWVSTSDGMHICPFCQTLRPASNR